MEGAKISRYVFIGLLLILLYLVFRLAQPFLNYIFMGIILTVAIYPFYNWFSKRIKNKKVSSAIVIILILLIIIIPTSIIAGVLASQARGMITSFDISYLTNTESFEKVNNYVIQMLGPNADLREKLGEMITDIGNFMVNSALKISGLVFETVLGLFVMFFIMYYGFVEGDNWFASIREVMPFNRERREKLVKRIKEVMQGVIYGQIFVAILQGALGGIGFFIVGINNPIFWGFIMTVLAFIPSIGTGLIWAPAGIIQLANHNIIGGIFLLVYGFFIVSGIDNVLKPKILSGKGNIHPIIALVSVLGGLNAFGLAGIITGPIIAALFMTMAEFFYEDYVKNR